MGRTKRIKSRAIDMYQSTYINHFERLKEIAQSVFKWNNLPEEIDERYLERALVYNNVGVFFYDEGLEEHLFTKCNINGQLDIYDNPVNICAIANNGYFRQLVNGKDACVIYDNMGRYPILTAIDNYAKRLTEVDMAIDINTYAQKTPLLLTCSDKQKATMLQLYEKYDGNEPVIFGYKDLEDMNKIGAIRTDAPYLIDKLRDEKIALWNEALTMLGVPNTAIEKGERLIRDEVAQQNGGILASRRSRLKARQEACKRINKLFGLNISVEFDEVGDDTVSDKKSEYGQYKDIQKPDIDAKEGGANNERV